jgi:hypothetical protein
MNVHRLPPQSCSETLHAVSTAAAAVNNYDGEQMVVDGADNAAATCNQTKQTARDLFIDLCINCNGSSQTSDNDALSVVRVYSKDKYADKICSTVPMPEISLNEARSLLLACI